MLKRGLVIFSLFVNGLYRSSDNKHPYNIHKLLPVLLDILIVKHVFEDIKRRIFALDLVLIK